MKKWKTMNEIQNERKRENWYTRIDKERKEVKKKKKKDRTKERKYEYSQSFFFFFLLKKTENILTKIKAMCRD